LRNTRNAVLLGCTDDRAAMEKRERIRRDEESAPLLRPRKRTFNNL
jgi:hypothetical protein